MVYFISMTTFKLKQKQKPQPQQQPPLKINNFELLHWKWMQKISNCLMLSFKMYVVLCSRARFATSCTTENAIVYNGNTLMHSLHSLIHSAHTQNTKLSQVMQFNQIIILPHLKHHFFLENGTVSFVRHMWRHKTHAH